MKKLVIVFSCVLSMALAMFSNSVLAGTPEQEKAFVDAYKKALEASDAKALEAFLYTEGAQAEQVEFFKMMQMIEPGAKVTSIALKAPEDPAKYEKAMEMPDGKEYKMPLKVTKELVISTETSGPNGSSSGTSTAPVGEKDGKFFILVPVPK